MSAKAIMFDWLDTMDSAYDRAPEYIQKVCVNPRGDQPIFLGKWARQDLPELKLVQLKTLTRYVHLWRNQR